MGLGFTLPPEIDCPRTVLPVFEGGEKSFAFEQLDERRGHEGRNDCHPLAGLEGIHPGADEWERFLPAGQIRANVEGFECRGFHGEWGRNDDEDTPKPWAAP